MGSEVKKKIKGKVIFIMGVSGSGKTSVGQVLAKELSLPFFDADDHHPASNVEKMRLGIPLDDDDRKPWLNKLNSVAKKHIKSGCVMACSALKDSYRIRLMNTIEPNVSWIYLHGYYNQIFERMKKREVHFMRENMLKSQFETLEEPKNAIKINIENSQEEIVRKIIERIE